MPWISKKAKAQMRARRKKVKKNKPKKSKEEYDESNNLNSDDEGHDIDAADTTNIDSNFNTSSTQSTTDDGTESLTVILASNLTAKEAKKLRKDARRKARKEQKDESMIRFVDEHGNLLSTSDKNNSNADKTHNDDDDDDENDNHHKDDDHNSISQETKKRSRHNDHHTNYKKPKISFPSINQILAQAEQIKQQKEEEQKRQAYQNSIPDEIKNQYVALDCEMVGIGTEGKQSALARVSITNWNGDTVLDTFVQVPDRVTDFRTFVSGIRAKDIKMTNSNSMELHTCRQKVGEIIHNKILVGHSLRNDFQALMMNHPRHLIRDTARYKPFMRPSGRSGGKMRPRKLRDLVKEHVGLVIQKEGEAHSSVDDAKATMELYKVARDEWEREIEKMDSKQNSIGKKRKKR